MTIAILAKLLPVYHRQINQRVYCQVMRLMSNVDSEYTDTPNYPPIKEVSWVASWRKKKVDWHNKIEKLPTVEQKLVELNMPKYYGYYSTLLEEKLFKPTSLDFIKFVTRTKLSSNFPHHYYDSEKVATNIAVNNVKDKVAELIVLHFGHNICRVKRDYKGLGKIERRADEIKTQNFIIDLNNLLMKSLNTQLPHLSCTSVDLRPRIEGFWFVGGFEASRKVKNARASLEFQKAIVDDPVDRAMRSSIFPALALRTGDGLPEIVPIEATGLAPIPSRDDDGEAEQSPPASEETCTSFHSFSVAPYDTEPTNWGFISRRRRAAIVPGFWPGVKDEHGHIFFHSRERMQEMLRHYPDYGECLLPSYLQQKAILSSFTQALSYALYQGFTTVNEMTYPLVQQYISTDGQKWQFGLYQLNTCCLHTNLSTQNPRQNLLWLSDDLKLFDEVQGNSVKGLNDEVLKLVVSMYLKKGTPTQNPHPYLADYKYLMHHDAPDEYKEEFQKHLLHLLSGRFSNRIVPEILPWERIYKVLFNTRPRDRKSKFFENRWALNPYKRRLDDYKLPYIPKVRRINFKIKYKPRLNSEHLFVHDYKTLKSASPVYKDDETVFRTMNIRKDTPPYYNGLKWSRGMIPTKTKI